MLRIKHGMSQQQSLLQEMKDISNILMHNITQCLHLKLSTSVLCVTCHSASLWIKQNVLEKSTAAIFNINNNATTLMQRLIFILASDALLIICGIVFWWAQRATVFLTPSI